MKKFSKLLSGLCALIIVFGALPAYDTYAAASSSTSVSSSVSQTSSETVKYGKVTEISGTKIKLSLGEYSSTTPPDMKGDNQNNNGTPPEKPAGDNGSTPPEKPSGESNANNTDTPPEKPSGESGQNDNGGTPPEMPSSFTANGKTLTLNLKSSKKLKKNGSSAKVSDIEVGDILKITYNSNNKITSIEILSDSGNGMAMPGGGNSEKSSVSVTGKYTVNSGSKKFTSKTVSTSDSDKSVILVSNGAKAKITDTKIVKKGDSSDTDSSNFNGLNAAVVVTENSSAAISGGSITTNAEGANAVFATGENAVINISGTTIRTKSNSSRGLDATYGGTIIADDMNIKTVGAHCAPVATDRGGGTITVSDSKLYASGDGSPCIYSTGNITAENCTGKATGSQAAVVEGKNSITLKSCNLTGAGKNGVMLYQSTSGDAEVGTAVFTSSDSTIKTTSTGPMFYITNTTAEINLTNTKLVYSSGILLNAAGNNTNNWGKVGSNGGNVTLNASSQTLKGDITCDNISTVTLNLGEDTTFTGAVDNENTGDVSVTLDSDAVWNVTADSYVSSITDKDSDYSNIKSNGYTVYYDSTNSANKSLNGKTITLSDGGKLAPM